MIRGWFFCLNALISFQSIAFGETQLDCKNAKKGQVLNESHNKIFEAEIADNVGFCNHHASRDLLHLTLCKYAIQPDDCFQPSVMDFLNEDAAANQNQRNSNYAISKILSNQRITTENCNSQESFFKPKRKTKYIGYNSKFDSAVSSVVLEQCKYELSLINKSSVASVERCDQTSENFIQIKALKEFITDQAVKNPLKTCKDLLPNGDTTSLMYRAIQANQEKLKCEKKSLPKLELKSIHYSFDTAARATELNHILNNGHSVQLVVKGPHAIVVSNFRYICESPNAKPILQYQVLDSLYGQNFHQKQPVSWVNATNRLGKGLLEKLHAEHGMFSWLEKQATIGFDYNIPKANGQKAAIFGIEENGAAYRSGIRNGMNFGQSETDPNTGEITVTINNDDGTTTNFKFIP